MTEPQTGEPVELILRFGYILLKGYFIEAIDCLIECLFGYFEFQRYLDEPIYKDDSGQFIYSFCRGQRFDFEWVIFILLFSETSA